MGHLRSARELRHVCYSGVQHLLRNPPIVFSVEGSPILPEANITPWGLYDSPTLLPAIAYGSYIARICDPLTILNPSSNLRLEYTKQA